MKRYLLRGVYCILPEAPSWMNSFSSFVIMFAHRFELDHTKDCDSRITSTDAWGAGMLLDLYSTPPPKLVVRISRRASFLSSTVSIAVLATLSK